MRGCRMREDIPCARRQVGSQRSRPSTHRRASCSPGEPAANPRQERESTRAPHRALPATVPSEFRIVARVERRRRDPMCSVSARGRSPSAGNGPDARPRIVADEPAPQHPHAQHRTRRTAAGALKTARNPMSQPSSRKTPSPVGKSAAPARAAGAAKSAPRVASRAAAGPATSVNGHAPIKPAAPQAVAKKVVGETQGAAPAAPQAAAHAGRRERCRERRREGQRRRPRRPASRR